MKYSISILLLLASIHCLAQRYETIRFVYWGEEDYPQGTLKICSGCSLKPDDRGLIDSLFGRTLVTDEKTVEYIINYITASPFIVDTVGTLTTRNERGDYYPSPFFEVKYWGAKKTILLEKYWKPFFSYLSACLEAVQLDQKVAYELKNFGWKPPKPNETGIRNAFSRYVQQWDSIHAQESRSIRFVYIGADTGNHGTVAICADEPIQPKDRPGDIILGKAYVTNWDGLRTLKSWIAKSKYVTDHIDHRLDSLETNKDRLLDKFMIIGVSDSPLYVQGENAEQLFIQLQVGGRNGVNSSAMSNLIRQINNDVNGRKPGSQIQIQKGIVDPYGKLRDPPDTQP